MDNASASTPLGTGTSGANEAASFEAEPVDVVLERLGVDREHGLSEREVQRRRGVHGFNEVVERRSHPVVDFARKFIGISAFMLELIIVLSAFLRKYADVAVVGALLVVNAVVSFVQERRAANVVETLRSRLRVDARVLRDRRWQRVPGRELVPGDIVRLRSGDIVPADLKVLAGATRVDQSALTGESTDVDRREGQVVPSGALVRGGEATCVVGFTGSRTYFGRTTELVQRSRPALHVERVVSGVVRWLFLIVATLLGLVTLASIARGEPLMELAPLILVLLMSAVPVALPVMFTVSMSVAARELADRGVLVTRLSATEDAATMDVLCVDKTGTITMNRLSITDVVGLGGSSEAEVLRAAVLASEEADQDPIDLAVFAAARERVGEAAVDRAGVESFVPFDASTRRTEAVVSESGERRRVLKGAVRAVAAECGLSTREIEELEERMARSIPGGHRTIAVASGPVGDRPELLGMLALFDPLRPDAGPLIQQLHELGVAVKVLTGDGLAVARATVSGIGLDRIERKADVDAAAGGTNDPYAAIDGLAEVYPEDKHAVVARLQAAGHVAGMTGDGVNDAPALRQAEVGIAVANATDVAKGAASVVLTRPGLTDIVTLVQQGRMIYQRVLTWIINKISRTILKSGFVCLAYLASGRFVISAFAMLLLVFLTDFAKIAIATDRVRPSKKPETWKIGGLVGMAAALGAAMLGETLASVYVGATRFAELADPQALDTFCFVALVYFAAFSLVSVRERRAFFRSMPSTTLLTGLAIELLVGTIVGLVGAPGMHALPGALVAGLFAYAAFACLVLNDALKLGVLRMIGLRPSLATS